MARSLTAVLLVLGLFCLQGIDADGITDENLAWVFVADYETKDQEIFSASTQAAWNYNTNLTDHNQQKMIDAGLVYSLFAKAASLNASEFNHNGFTNYTLKRLFSKIQDIGTDALDDQDKLKRLSELTADMENIYSTGQVTIGGEKLDLDPGLTQLLATSRDHNKLLEAWVGWRHATGKKMKKMYEEFAALSNEAIQANGFADTGVYWRSRYESDTLVQDVKSLYQELTPLYKNLHIYVRRKLKEQYGAENFPSEGHIPAHLLGNMWGQQWNNLLDIMQPYKNKTSVDVTPAMQAQGYTPVRMFNVSEEFFTSLGLIPMPREFWEHSMLKKPEDGRNVVCHASAWDFYNQRDFRIKQCTKVTMDDLITVHHEMGHVEYFLQYKHQPTAFRRGANPGFHEAVGDVLALSVSTPAHLHKIGLLETVTDDEESDLNFLMSMALEKIAFLPFGYLMDQWRWSVFDGNTSINQYNTKWWDLRCKYQGISPPVRRSEEDFDPGAKYHIPANTPYIRYFVSFVIQFQFQKSLCEIAGQTGPLHKCDIYQSRAAGDKLAQVLRMGSSRPWTDAMRVLIGSDKMSAAPLMDYFQPLTTWLIAENQKAGDVNGWTDKCPDLSGASPIAVSMIAILSAMVLFSMNL